MSSFCQLKLFWQCLFIRFFVVFAAPRAKITLLFSEIWQFGKILFGESGGTALEILYFILQNVMSDV
jgi:hypothetical protein